MFGYVTINKKDLSDEDFKTYQSYYCGICHDLRVNHGFSASFTLSYDMVFLVLVLSSLYEPQEIDAKERCAQHPVKSHDYRISDVSSYAADMTVLLTYHKAQDDWKDEKRQRSRLLAKKLYPAYQILAEKYPEQSYAMESCIARLSELEGAGTTDADACAKCFGELMRAIFVTRHDIWEKSMGDMAEALGQFIYIMDAFVDYDSDIAHDRFNPLRNFFDNGYTAEDVYGILTMLIGDSALNFEKLPLVEHIDILRNILYSGVWTKFPHKKINTTAEDEKANDK